jgi:hypothetical protein
VAELGHIFGVEGRSHRDLPWRNGDYTQGTIPCGEPPISFRVSPTFIYEHPLDNFIAGHQLIETASSWGKAETHRLGYENSEDALTWNVFRSLQEAERLGIGAAALASVESRAEPTLYLWGPIGVGS